MKKIIICLIGLICLVGCSNNQKSKLDKIIEKKNYLIIDVRTIEEFKESHVKGAINIPYDEISAKTKLDKKKTMLVYCKSGGRSKKAYDTLKSLGYDVVDLGAFDTIDLEKTK